MKRQRLARGSRFARAVGFAAVAMLVFSGVQLALSSPAAQATAKFRITTKTLPDAIAGAEYYAVIAAAGGEAPYSFSGTGLPPNLAFHPYSDTIGGKATAPGTYAVVITAEDSTSPPQKATATLKLTVAPPK